MSRVPAADIGSLPAITRPLPPTESPLRPLCPSCGAERVVIATSVTVSFDVAAPLPLGDLQVLAHRLADAEWDDDDRAHCPSCAWHGRAADLG